MPAEYTPAASNELSDYVRVVRRRWRLIAAIVVIFVALAAAYSLTRATQYAASAKVQIPSPAGQVTRDQSNADVATELAVMKSQAVAQRAADRLRSKSTADELSAKVQVVSPPDARVLTVTFTAASAVQAQRGAQAFADAYIETKKINAQKAIDAQTGTYQRTIDGYTSDLKKAQTDLLAARTPAETAAAQTRITQLNNNITNAQTEQSKVASSPIDPGAVLQPAERPKGKAGSGLPTNLAIGLFAGLAVGLGAAFVRERLDEQVHEPADIEEVLEVPNLGSIPRFPERFRARSTALVTVHAPEGGQADSFRRLRAALLVALRDHHVQAVAITSPTAGDGKSTIAANLAVTLAQSGRSVVLISADVRRPSLQEFFELEDGVGMLDVLAGEATFDQAIVPVGRFPVMTSGRTHANPTDLLQSAAMEKLVADARSRFDLVIIDTPPVLAVADVLGMVPMLDAVLLVVSVDQTTEAEVAEARSELLQAGATILGAVVNRSTSSTARYDAYYR